jgi:uncharacterized membrane protein YhaH (DUF805 family)
MATLKQLLANKTNSTSLDFRKNENTSADGTVWGNAWVEGKSGKLLCVGATVATLEQLAANPNLDTLMLTKPEPRVDATTGLEYDMCQLFINDSIKISLVETSSSVEIKSNDLKNSSSIMNNFNQKLIKSLFTGFLIAIILGYLFSTEIYLYKGYEVSGDENYTFVQEAFNYKLSTLSFALVSGFMFFVFYDEKRKMDTKNKIISLFGKYNSTGILEFFSLIEIKKKLLLYFKNKLFNFSGRVSRVNFFGEMLALNLVSYPFFMSLQNETNFFFKFIFLVIYFFFLVKIHVRRLHDINFSGWYSMIYLIPFGIYLLGLLTKWDFLKSIILSGWNVLFGIIIIYNLILLIMPGNKFTNTYGEENKGL